MQKYKSKISYNFFFYIILIKINIYTPVSNYSAKNPPALRIHRN